MKRSELLDLMGEIDSAYIEDTAAHLERSPRRLLQRWARPVSAVAVAGFMGFSIFVIYGIVRDGIASQNPSSYVQSAAHSPETTLTADTVPSDIYEEQPITTMITTVILAETTTTGTTLIPTYEIPADEMPSAAIYQEAGDRFSVNSLSSPGVFAMTITDAQYYDTLADAGLSFGELTYQFRQNQYFNVLGYNDENGNPIVYTMTDASDAKIWNQVQAKYEDYRFIKVTLTVENLNAVSPEWLRLRDGEMRAIPDEYFDRGYSRREYDFDMTSMQFGIFRNPDYETEKYEIHGYSLGIAYFNLCGQAYPKNDDFGRGDWFYLEPGEVMFCEVGGFVPKNTDVVSGVRETLWTEELHYEKGTDLLPYYFFGSAGTSGPYISLNFSEEE